MSSKNLFGSIENKDDIKLGFKLIKYAEEIPIKRVKVQKIHNESFHHLVGKTYKVFALARDHQDNILVLFYDFQNKINFIDADCVSDATLRIV